MSARTKASGASLREDSKGVGRLKRLGWKAMDDEAAMEQDG